MKTSQLKDLIKEHIKFVIKEDTLTDIANIIGKALKRKDMPVTSINVKKVADSIGGYVKNLLDDKDIIAVTKIIKNKQLN